MQNINFHSLDNLSGVSVFYVIDCRDVVSIPPIKNNILDGDITLLEGKVFAVCVPSLGSLSYREPSKETRSGTLYSHELKGFFPRDTPELQTALEHMKGKRIMALYRDNNGLLKLVGSANFWLTYEADTETSTAGSGRNGVAFTLKGESPVQAAVYVGSLPVQDIGVLPGGGVVGSSSNNTVKVYRGDGTLLATLTAGQNLIITSGFSYGLRIF